MLKFKQSIRKVLKMTGKVAVVPQVQVGPVPPVFHPTCGCIKSTIPALPRKEGRGSNHTLEMSSSFSSQPMQEAFPLHGLVRLSSSSSLVQLWKMSLLGDWAMRNEHGSVNSKAALIAAIQGKEQIRYFSFHSLGCFILVFFTKCFILWVYCTQVRKIPPL